MTGVGGGRRRTLSVGLTGPIGCGKSTVAGWLGQRPDVVVVDADVVAREVLAPGTSELGAVFARFGRELERVDGTLDRPALGRIVFAEPDALRELEAIVHPAVRQRILASIDAAEACAASAIVIEAIKLVQGGLADLCDEVWLVTCERPVQLERLLRRGTAADDAASRIAAQGDLVVRLAPRAVRIIDTSGGQAATRALVDVAFAEASDRVT